jgi:hypothetical protein
MPAPATYNVRLQVPAVAARSVRGALIHPRANQVMKKSPIRGEFSLNLARGRLY